MTKENEQLTIFLPGAMYSFRIRARNQMGLGEWSEPFYISSLVSDTPIAENKPVAENQDGTDITLDWTKESNQIQDATGGAKIDSYRIMINSDVCDELEICDSD